MKATSPFLPSRSRRILNSGALRPLGRETERSLDRLPPCLRRLLEGFCFGTGADMVAALSLINVVLVAVGLTVALRFGVKLHD